MHKISFCLKKSHCKIIFKLLRKYLNGHGKILIKLCGGKRLQNSMLGMIAFLIKNIDMWPWLFLPSG